MNRIYSPSPTVRSSVVPLYMRGLGRHMTWHLGQDDGSIDETLFLDTGVQAPSVDASGTFDPTMYTDTSSLIAPISTLTPQDQALAQLYQSSVAAGTMTPAQATSAIAQLTTGAAAVAKAATGVSTAPAPRVTLPAVVATAPNPLTASTVISGVPNWTLLAAAAAIALMMGQR